MGSGDQQEGTPRLARPLVVCPPRWYAVTVIAQRYTGSLVHVDCAVSTVHSVLAFLHNDLS